MACLKVFSQFPDLQGKQTVYHRALSAEMSGLAQTYQRRRLQCHRKMTPDKVAAQFSASKLSNTHNMSPAGKDTRSMLWVNSFLSRKAPGLS